MKNYGNCVYTYRHRKAFLYAVKKIILDSEKDEMIIRANNHDLDKLCMYLFLDKDKTNIIHRKYARHHLDNSIEKNYYDKLEAIIDFECAAYTKKDKPLNAYDTLRKYYPNYMEDEELTTILSKYNLNYSYSVLDDLKGLEYLKEYDIVTKKDIYKDINTNLKRKVLTK